MWAGEQMASLLQLKPFFFLLGLLKPVLAVALECSLITV